MSLPPPVEVVDAAGGADVAVIDAEVGRAKIRFSKRILFVMFGIFGIGCIVAPAHSTIARMCLIISGISFYHGVFHFWCDSEDTSTMLKRHHYHIYLVIFSNLGLVWAFSSYNDVFARGLTILVMPLAFTREASSRRLAEIFVVLHFGMVAYSLRGDLFGDGGKWLANLVIVDAMLIDICNLRVKASELGWLLQKAYADSQHVAHCNIKHLLSSVCDAFVVVDANMVLSESSPTLAAMLTRNPSNHGKDMIDFVDFEDRERLQQHFSEFPMDGHAGSETCVLSSLRLRLLDNMNKPVTVLMFFAMLWGADGECNYYVGISHAYQQLKAKKPPHKAVKLGTISQPNPESHGFLQRLATSSSAKFTGSDRRTQSPHSKEF